MSTEPLADFDIGPGPAVRSARPMTLETGARLGPYEVLEPIGAGGMGEVYRARELAEGLAKAQCRR